MSNILFVFLFVLLMSLSVFFANLAFKKGKNVKKVLRKGYSVCRNFYKRR